MTSSARHGRRAAVVSSLLVSAVLVGSPAGAVSQEVPYLSGRVVDLADLIDASRQSDIEAALAAFERETGTQIAVLTVPSLEGGSIEDFSIRVAEAWQLGRGEFDDGVLMLIARDDRRMRIEVGYGLEGALTDAESRRILDRVLTPAFRRGDFGAGIADGITAIMAEVRGETPPPEILPEGEPGGFGGEEAVAALVQLAFFLFVIWMMARSSRRRGRAWSSRTGWGPVHPDWSDGTSRRGRFPIVFLPPIGRGGDDRGGRRRGGGGFGGFGGGGGFGGFGGGGGGFGGGGASGGW